MTVFHAVTNAAELPIDDFVRLDRETVGATLAAIPRAS